VLWGSRDPWTPPGYGPGVSRRLFNSNNFTTSAALAEVYALLSALFQGTRTPGAAAQCATGAVLGNLAS